MKNINIAIIGLGGRGKGNLKTLLKLPNLTVVGLCDEYDDFMEEAVSFVENAGGKRPFCTNDFNEILKMPELDAVMIFTSWETHIQIAIASMKAHKIVGLEVGGAYSVSECWDLVRTYEETKTPIMLLENCCYNKTEEMVTAMARDGIFGEIVHCHGSYAHDLREEITYGKEKRHYRLRNYISRNCENYPTHELGPIAKLLDINRGNRMVSLVSVASKSAGLKHYINTNKEKITNPDLFTTEFRQGDIVNTIITCANGQTISLKLDTTLPRSYSREFTVRGTIGMYEENTNSVFLDGDEENFETIEYYKKAINNAVRYEDKYLTDYWKNLTEEEKEAGHGGMDFYLFNEFFKAIREEAEMPIDVYDAAAWMVISCLSEESIQKGGSPVSIPDFTDGKWLIR